ncbi:DNA polymerase III alpha subunit [Vibrio chagasii]|nr:DNA polymerase III alpha subunit [Vibrio chagasii]
MTGLALFQTHHSYHEATGKTQDYINAAKERGIDKLIMCDRVQMADMIKFYDKSKSADIEPIMGAMFKLAHGERVFKSQFARNKDFFTALQDMALYVTSFELPYSYLAENFDTIAQEVVKKICKIATTKATATAIEKSKREISISLLNYAKDLGASENEISKKIEAIKTLKKGKIDFLFGMLVDSNFELSPNEGESDFPKFFTALKDEATKYKEISESSYSDLVLVSFNQAGFTHLKELVSWSYIDGQTPDLVEISSNKRKVYSCPKLLFKHLKSSNDGTVAIIGLEGDELGKAIKYNGSYEEVINYYKGIFGDRLIIGVERSATEEDGQIVLKRQDEFNNELLSISSEYDIPAIALNRALFVNKEDSIVHDVKSTIILEQKQGDVTRELNFHKGHYLKSWAQVKDEFSDLPELVSNAERINIFFDKVSQQTPREKVLINLNEPVLPEFPIPDSYTPTTFMKHLAEKGLTDHFKIKLEKKFGTSDTAELSSEQRAVWDEITKVYYERLDFEVDVIDSMGFPGYFLIVSDFIVWGKNNGVPIGPGRGSGAGSLVAYGLKITNIDPIKHDLLFERFLNPERVSMPDFDIDFGSGFHPETGELVTRDSVIQYVADMYNDVEAKFPSVGQIATHGLMAAKSAVKAIGKTLGLSVRFGEDLTSQFPDEPETTVAKCLLVDSVQEHVDNEPITKLIMELTAASEGLKKSSGTHAGGVVIAPRSITEFSPVQSDVKSPHKLITQQDKNDVETGGLVKFDFLGLANLTTMSFAIRSIFNRTGVRVNLDEIDMDDMAVYELLQTGNSYGVFQVESAGMRDLLRRLKVENIEEYSALIALFRPGPLQSGMVDNFIDRKHGREEVSYPDSQYQHESLKPILEPTYGIILYQEQVMQIAQVLAGYSLGGADILRRAMGKKKPEEMAKQREIFKEGAEKNGIDPDLSMKIFDLVEKFAGYGFNKSHSMSYAYISYHTAWLKTHYPCEYMAAVLTSVMGEHDKLRIALQDCKKNGIEILPPDINKSDAMFTPEGDMSIRFGLGAVLGVGHAKLVKILDEREKNGAFESLPEVAFRCRSAFDARVSESLVLAGAFDSVDTVLNPKLEGETYDAIEIKRRELESQREELLSSKRHLKNIPTLISDAKDEGKQTKEILDSLITFYSDKYGFKCDWDIPFNERLKLIWSFFGESILGDEDLSIKHGEAAIRGLSDDFEVLKERIVDVQRLSKHYYDLCERREELEEHVKSLKSKGCPETQEEIDFALQGEIDQLLNENAESDVASSDVIESPRFELRAFLLAEATYMSQFKVKDLAPIADVHEVLGDLSYSDVSVISDKDRLKSEKDRLSFYVTGHPLDVDNLRHALDKKHGTRRLDKLVPSKVNEDGEITNRKEATISGVIDGLRIVKVKKEGKNFGKEMAILSIDDGYGSIKATVFPDAYPTIKPHIFIDEPVCINGTIQFDTYANDGSLEVVISKVFSCKTHEVVYEDSRGNKKKW